MDATLKHTPFYDLHRENNARFAPFAGWEMPIQYATGAIGEHKHVRTHLGVFDTSHMGRFELRGGQVAEFLDYAISSDILNLPENTSRYGLLCRENGGIIDDVFVYRLADHFLVVVNASNLEKDYRHLDNLRDKFDVELVDRSNETVMLAIQGPGVISFLDLLATSAVSDIPRFGAVVTGMYAPTVDAYAANVYLETAFSKVGTILEIEIRGKRKTVEVVKRPLYTPSYR